MRKIIALLFFFILFSFANAQITENITLTNNIGETIQSQVLIDNGKAKVFVFWSSYCAYCKLEMKGIRNIGQNWLKDYNAEVVFVSLEQPTSNAYDKINFIDDLKKEGFYLLYDHNMQLYNVFGLEGIPGSVLLTKNGKIHQKWNAYDDGLERSIGMYFKKLSQAN